MLGVKEVAWAYSDRKPQWLSGGPGRRQEEEVFGACQGRRWCLIDDLKMKTTEQPGIPRMFLFATVAAWSLASAHAQAPKISVPPIPAIAGETLEFQIEASNSPDSYNATPVAANPSIQVSVNATGLVTIVLGADVQPQDFDIDISAANEDGMDTQKLTLQIQAIVETGGPVDNTDVSNGSPRVFQGKLSVKPPTLRVQTSEIASAVNLNGVIITQGELIENPDKGTFSQPIVTKRISNKDVLELMKAELENGSIAGYSLQMVGPADGGISGQELVAAKKNSDPIPVPEAIFSLVMSEGVTGFKEKTNADGDTVKLMREQYVPVSAEWRNEAGGSERISLSGIGKMVTKLKAYKIEGEPSSYEASGLNANLSGQGGTP
jgi:hypothetical protein